MGGAAGRRGQSVWGWSRLSEVAVVLVVAGISACDGQAPRTSVGEHGAFGGTDAFTWANINADGQVREFGITLPMQGLSTLPAGFSMVLALPVEVQSTTPLQTVMVEFKQRNILPPIYQVPRLDVRFLTLRAADLNGIDCVAEPMPGADALPAPYVVESTAPEPDGSCVPRIGVHAYDSTAPELVPDNHIAFQQAVFLGFHGGHIIFIDPTQPIEQTEQAKAFDANVPRPADLAAGTRWPAHVMVVPDAQKTLMNFSLGQIQTQ